MVVDLIFVPPGGGEVDYALSFELPALPKNGDYITILRDERKGMENFIVRRVLWDLRYVSGQKAGSTMGVRIECEFARGRIDSDEHKRSCDMYAARGRKIPNFDASGY